MRRAIIVPAILVALVAAYGTTRTVTVPAAPPGPAGSSPAQVAASTPTATGWQAICNSQLGNSDSTWTSTDALGNKATFTDCGYTLTGEDTAGNSAPAGQFYANVVVSVQDDQSDRAAQPNPTGIYIGPADACTTYPNGYGCPAFVGPVGVLYPSGAIGPQQNYQIQPGPPQMWLYTSLMNTTDGPLALYLDQGNPAQIQVARMAGLGAGEQTIPL